MATYIILNVIVLAVLVGIVRRRAIFNTKPFNITLLILLLTTAIFDSLIVVNNIVAYNHSKILGIYIGSAPIEDLCYALAAAIIVPALWHTSRRPLMIPKLLFHTSRPISWINTAYPFAAGYCMLGGGLDVRLIVGSLFFLIPYNLLMYGINDVFDYESDIVNPRKGGVEGAITPKKYHPVIIWTSILFAAPFIIALATMGNTISVITLLAVIFFVIAYSAKGLRFKEIPFLDSVTSSLHFVGPLIYAYSLVGANTAAWLAAAAFFAWGIASQAFGAVQDIVPDRDARIQSIATVLGARNTIWFSACMYLLAVLLTSLIGGLGIVVGCAGLIYVWNALEFRRITDQTSHRARRGWRRFMWLNYLVGAIITICLILSKTINV